MTFDDIQEHIVIVNKGSGCIFQPKNCSYTYILTAKHVTAQVPGSPGRHITVTIFTRNENAVWEEKEFTITLKEGINYFPHKDCDIAIVVVDRMEGRDKLIRARLGNNRKEFNLAGYPECRRDASVKSDWFGINEHFNLKGSRSNGLREAEALKNLVIQEIKGQSGGGLLKIMGKYIMLAGIQIKMLDGEQQLGQIEFAPLENFDAIINQYTQQLCPLVNGPLITIPRPPGVIMIVAAILLMFFGIGFTWGCDICFYFFPKPGKVIIVNTIDGDNDQLRLKRGITDNITAECQQLTASGGLELAGDSGDVKKILQAFVCNRYDTGVFAYGSFRPVDSVLSGNIYLHHMSINKEPDSSIVLPVLDDISVTVSKKTALFGDFIAALFLQRTNNFEKSNVVLNKIKEHSFYLHADFKQKVEQVMAINYVRLGDIDSARYRLQQAKIDSLNGDDIITNVSPRGFVTTIYTIHSPGRNDTIKEYDHDWADVHAKTSPYIVGGFDTTYIYNNYAVLQSTNPSVAHIHILRLDTREKTTLNLPLQGIRPYIDSLNKKAAKEKKKHPAA